MDEPVRSDEERPVPPGEEPAEARVVGSLAPQGEPEGEAQPEEEALGVAGGSTVAALQEAVARKEAEAKELHDRLLRLHAEFDNYRKRVAREKAELAEFGHARLVRELLPAIDNLERALEHARGVTEVAPLAEGVAITLNQILSVLKKFGVEPTASEGEPFDPTRHEAVGQVETADHAPDTVVHEAERGYLLNNRLLRPARVLVARPPASAQTEPAAPAGAMGPEPTDLVEP